MNIFLEKKDESINMVIACRRWDDRRSGTSRGSGEVENCRQRVTSGFTNPLGSLPSSTTGVTTHQPTTELPNKKKTINFYGTCNDENRRYHRNWNKYINFPIISTFRSFEVFDYFTSREAASSLSLSLALSTKFSIFLVARTHLKSITKQSY